MREISISTDVFATIWSLRKFGEERENDILERVLKEFSVITSNVNLEFALGDDGTKAYVARDLCGDTTFSLEEGKASKAPTYNSSKNSNQTAEFNMGKIRWVDDVRSALRELGGQSSLHSLYKKVEELRRNGGRSIPRTLEATIRRTLEDHSSDSANFRGIDIFAKVGRGEWALR